MATSLMSFRCRKSGGTARARPADWRRGAAAAHRACATLAPCPQRAGLPSRSTHARAAAAKTRDSATSERAGQGTVLVLGGTGFVGSEVTKAFLRSGFDVVAVSRRAESASLSASSPRLKLVSVDLVKEPYAVVSLLEDHAPVRAVVHCIGMLLPNSLNALASGSGSVPPSGATYDAVTRATACAAADAVATYRPGCPLVFLSAAEASWPEDAPLVPTFLKRYLEAKRAVESHLSALTSSGSIRATCLRPSLIWSPDRPAALAPVAAFTLGNRLGLPGVDKPVQVTTVASAVVAAVTDETASGLWTFKEMEDAAKV